ncbi:MAG: aminoacyl-histidine dipeptidase [Bacteroidales bacterium]
MEKLKGLEPKVVWEYFEQICEIPRPSKKEKKIIQFLQKFAEQNNLESKKDKAGNLVIKKPGTKGKENLKPVVLQSHVDMVGEKNKGTDHNFETDPIKPYIEGDWVKAEGTTLGADDGIGIAAQLAILASDEIQHGPVECLFTVDEETGLTGAFALESDFFDGKILINLDSEDEGELFIGCAGGIDTVARINYDKEKSPSDHIGYRLFVTGLNGGHSGDEIHKGFGNSLKIANRFIWEINDNYDVRISTFTGGSARNAIPREAEIIMSVHQEDIDDVEKFYNKYKEDIKNELRATEPNLDIIFEKIDKPQWIIDEDSQYDLINALYACPHGVYEWSKEIEDLVETSTNLASIKIEEDERFFITTSQRSSVETAKRDIANMVESVFRLAGAKVKHSSGYPGWQPDTDSEIMKITRDAYKKLFNTDPEVKAIHAGLECGLFLQKYPYLDMISFGPTIKGAHTPEEKISIETTEKFWKLLLEVLDKIPEDK